MVTRVRITPKTEFLPKVLPKMIFKVQFNHIKCLVPNCPGAKLSGAKLSWRQIVLVPNCPVPNCPTIKIRYHIFHFKHIHPQNEKQKKQSFILMRTQIGFNLKCIAQCICSKSSGLTFFGQYSKTVIISHTNLFKNAILGSTQLLATTLMKLD